jgi:5-methylcytosine-specific restriction endonuclease McrA
MPYVNKPRPYKKEWQQEKKRDEKPARAARARARRKMDADGVDRKSKVIDHIKPLSKGGTNAKSNLRLTSRSKNASFERNSDRSVKRNK